MTEIIFISGCCLLAFNIIDGCVTYVNKEQEFHRDIQLKMTYLPPKEQFKKSVFYEISGICINFKNEESEKSVIFCFRNQKTFDKLREEEFKSLESKFKLKIPAGWRLNDKLSAKRAYTFDEAIELGFIF